MLPLPVLMTLDLADDGQSRRADRTAHPADRGAAVVARRHAARLPLIAPDSSYWTGRFPMILVMAIGMTIAVAPLTSSVLGSVEEQHVAMASGFNSAVARIGGLIATALLGSVLASEGERLFAGFHGAMFVSAVVAASQRRRADHARRREDEANANALSLRPRRLRSIVMGGDERLDDRRDASRATCGR